MRQWRIAAAADRTAAEPFFPLFACRGVNSRYAPAHTVVTDSAAAHRAGLPVGDLFAA